MELLPEKLPAVICDLDGTLCLFNGRGPFEMDQCGTDLPNPPVVATLHAFRRQGYAILLVSGRFERVRPLTVQWLARHLIPYEGLWLRADGDYRPDAIIKPELYAQFAPQYDIVLALDDRDSSVACWRALGVPCFQVAPGNF